MLMSEAKRLAQQRLDNEAVDRWASKGRLAAQPSAPTPAAAPAAAPGQASTEPLRPLRTTMPETEPMEQTQELDHETADPPPWQKIEKVTERGSALPIIPFREATARLRAILFGEMTDLREGRSDAARACAMARLAAQMVLLLRAESENGRIIESKLQGPKDQKRGGGP